PTWSEADDPSLRMALVGLDASLKSEEGDGRDAELVQGHRHQWGRNALTGREQQVELARGRVFGNLRRQAQQVVGRVPHGAHHDDDVVARPLARGAARWRPPDLAPRNERRVAQPLRAAWSR